MKNVVDSILMLEEAYVCKTPCNLNIKYKLGILDWSLLEIEFSLLFPPVQMY